VIKLAYNDQAVLIKTHNREYWYIVKGFDNHGCFDEQSVHYNAIQALESFEKSFGKAVWINPKLRSL
jgi:hypothetical protein